MLQQEIIEKLKMENARAKLKHGHWSEFPKDEQRKAISREVLEWRKAYRNHDIYGEHGEVAELIQVMNVCMRRVMYLTGEPDA